MASKIEAACATSAIGWRMGCDVGPWSARYASSFSPARWPAQACGVGGGPGRGPVAGELGEGLVEPEVVPPAHRDDVAEPHVGHLVQQDLGEQLALGPGRLRPPQQCVRPGHASVVLHRAAELRHEHLVVAPLRERHPEHLAEELQALRRDPEDLVGVPVEDVGQRATGVQPQVVPAGLAPALVEGPGVDDGVVGRQRRRRREGPAAAPAQVLDARVAGVARDGPRGRRGDREGVHCLEVGLVEAGPDEACLVRFERRPQVDLAVGRVHGAMDAGAAAGLRLLGLDPQGVPAAQPREPDPPLRCGRQRLAVQRGGEHVGGAVDEGLGVRPAAGEGDGRDAADAGAVGQRGQVDLDVVTLDLEQCGALLGLDLGETGDLHRSSSTGRARTTPRGVDPVTGVPTGSGAGGPQAEAGSGVASVGHRTAARRPRLGPHDAREMGVEGAAQLVRGRAGPAVDRHAGALRLLERGTLGDRRREDERAEHVRELGHPVAVLGGAVAVAVDHDPEGLQLGCDGAAEVVDGAQGAVGRGDGEQRRLGDHHGAVAGHEPGSGEAAERRRAVDDDEPVVVARPERLTEAGEGALRGPAPVVGRALGGAGDDVEPLALLHPPAGGDGGVERLAPGIAEQRRDVDLRITGDVQGQRGVGLRIEVHDERGHPLGESGGGQSEGDGGLADPTLQAAHAHHDHAPDATRSRHDHEPRPAER